MRDPFANYDNWLERPYQDMMEESDRFYDWAEEEGYEVDDPEDMKLAELAYEAMLQGNAEDYAVEQHEAYLDRMEWEAQEIDDYFDESW